MAFNADVIVLTQPGATGQQTYSLAAGFDPKAVILWATPNTADGSIADIAFGVGFGTYQGSVVQQRTSGLRMLDNSATGDPGYEQSNTAVLRLMTQGVNAGTIDLEIRLISMQGGGTSQVVLDWVNLHTTASVRVFMLVLGGSDITDALVDDFLMGTGSTTQDETVASGFGQPDLLFFIGANATNFAAAPSTCKFSFGFAKKGEAGRSFACSQLDGNTASCNAARQRSDRCLMEIISVNASTATDNALARLDTVTGNWPTDGFRLLYDANPAIGTRCSYLAIRTTAQIATGATGAPTAGGLPVNQDNNAGFVPKLGFLFGWNLAAATTLQTQAADQIGFGIGAYDASTEAWAGFTDDDNLGTMDSNQQQSITKVIQNYSPAAALQSEADGAFSGNNFRLSWNDIDTVAREYQWIAIGDATAVETTDAGTVTLSLTPSGAEIEESVDSGTVALGLIPTTTQEGIERADSGEVVVGLIPSGADIGVYTDAGTLEYKFTPASTDIGVYSDSATTTLSLRPNSTDVYDGIDQQIVAMGLLPSSLDVYAAVETGTSIVTLLPSSVEIEASIDSSTVQVLFTPSGVEASQFVESATIRVNFTPSAVEFSIYTDASIGVQGSNPIRVVFSPSGTDTLTGASVVYTDAATASINLSPSGLETYAGVDAESVRLTTQPSSIETYQPSDTGTVTALLTPASTEVASYGDLATATLKNIPSGSDIYTPGMTDVGTVYLQFKPMLRFVPKGILYGHWIVRLRFASKQAADVKRFLARSAKPRWRAKAWKA